LTTRSRKPRIPPNDLEFSNKTCLLHLSGKNGGTALISPEDSKRVLMAGPFYMRKINDAFVAAASKPRTNGGKLLLAKFIMEADDDCAVMHKNADCLDCRRENLVTVKHPLTRKNEPGIYYDRQRHKWRVSVQRNKKRVYIARVDTLEEALIVRQNYIKTLST
jgi:hypothetical protein